ncbi:MAG: hypothetical protein Q8R55_01805 [Candidatus Taylorbacteria bacterium]|nr:hypothetical protein [Candidatus Taylorbacteria bacterium]
MFRRDFLLVYGPSFIFSLAGCNRFKSPTAPDDPLPPDQSHYESLPTEKHYLVDPGTKQETKMWARLLPPIEPPRGSTVVPPGCPAQCFKYILEIGMDPTSNPYVMAIFKVNFGLDEDKELGDSIGGGSILNNTSTKIGSMEVDGHSGMLIPFQFVAKYLVVNGSHNRSDASEPPRTYGKTTFFLDYK